MVPGYTKEAGISRIKLYQSPITHTQISQHSNQTIVCSCSHLPILEAREEFFLRVSYTRELSY